MRTNKEKYILGISKNVACVKEALDGSTILTRKEKFDAAFKMYFVGDEGDISRLGVNSMDRRKARFCSEVLRKSLSDRYKKYSFKLVKSDLRRLILSGYMKGVSTGLLSLSFKDECGILYVSLKSGGKEIYSERITSSEDAYWVLLEITSIIVFGGSDTRDDFFICYLSGEFNNYLSRTTPQVYTEKCSHSLSDRVSKVRLNGEKVITFKVG